MSIHVAALIGSFLFIAIRLKMEKQKSDDNPRYHIKWKKYFSKEWDDFMFSIAAGQALVYFQESIFMGYTAWKKWPHTEALSVYNDSAQVIAGSMGLIGSVLIMVLFKYAIRKANKLVEK